jgi:hypothetical protein
MSSSNTLKPAIIEETSFGVVPASAMQYINLTKPALKRQRTVQRPNIIRGDRRRYASRVLQENGTLALDSFLQYGNLDKPFEGFQNSAWGSTVTVTASTISFTASSKTIADSGNGLASFAVGDVVFISGAAESTNNGVHGLVTSKAAGSLVVQTTLADESAGASVTIQTTRCYDATTLKSYAYQHEYSDLTTTFRNGKGFRIGEMNMEWSVGNYVSQNFTGLGKVPKFSDATLGSGAPTAAPTSSFMSSLSTDFLRFFEGGAASSVLVTKMALRGTNNQAIRNSIGQEAGPAGVSVFSSDYDLSLDMYMDANARTLLEKAESHTATSLWWAVGDPEGNRMAYVIGAAKPDEGDDDISGPDAENNAMLKLTAYQSTTYPYTFAAFKKAA